METQTNPESLAAYERVSPFVVADRERIWSWLHENGPHTCKEVSLGLPMYYTTASARMSELKKWACS